MHSMTYSRQGDYLIPDLALMDQTGDTLGKYGILRRTYLKNHRPILYNSLLLQGKLHLHLTEIDRTAHQRLDQLMTELTARTPPPDKATDPMAWTAHMNSLKAQAEEMILAELIYN